MKPREFYDKDVQMRRINTISNLTQWRDVQSDPKWGFATDESIDEIFRNLPCLVMDKDDGCIEIINNDNAAEWRGDLERKPYRYLWQQIYDRNNYKL